MGFREELGKRILFLDGGMGSLLQEKGLAKGELPETWNLSHAETIQKIHEDYLAAGADIVLANTFGANRFKYPDNLKDIVEAGIANAKNAVEKAGRGYVALDIGSLGKLLKPLGTLDFEEAVSVFAEIVTIGEKAGADLIVIETMNDSYELKAAVLAAKENSSLPVIATVIFDESRKMLTGSSPAGTAALLEGLRVDVLGMNCGLGPKQMKPIFEELASYTSIPLAISPNAGLPREENGNTVYDVTPEEFASDMEELVKMGAWIVGGCCGTTPAHIEAMTRKCREIVPKPLTEKNITMVTSFSQAVELGKKPVIIGERINPTGKSKFKQALRDENMEYILEEGVKQADHGAHILDVNVGLPEIDEPQMMEKTVCELQSILALPLQIDTTKPAAMERALRRYNGKAMVNSVNGKEEVMDEIFPIVQKYGGVVVGLTLDEDGIPETVEKRLEIAEKIIKKAAEYGIKKKDIVIDALTMTMSTDSNAANLTLETVRELTKRGIHTVLGVSNISFGLPQREIINSNFFTLALSAGLSAGIINPNAAAMKQAYDAFCLLHGFDEGCMTYISAYTLDKEAGKTIGAGITEKKEMSLKECIIKGLKDPAYRETKEALKTRKPLDLINEELVPALDQVGKGFEKKTIFLPQLLMSAEAAKAGFEAIREYVVSEGIPEEKKATVVIATVKGDIHDIGKNIVKVLLENYGYDVIDLGKDVPPEEILETVVKTKAPLVGLSALMTTTVSSMKETIELLRKEAPWCKVMVGGAVLTQEYADRIGADFYGKDAMQSVYYAESMFA